MKSDGTYKFTWDAADRLVRVNLESDDSLVANYKYDSSGRRVYENVNSQETYCSTLNYNMIFAMDFVCDIIWKIDLSIDLLEKMDKLCSYN